MVLLAIVLAALLTFGFHQGVYIGIGVLLLPSLLLRASFSFLGRTRRWIAFGITPFFYARGLFWLVRTICGRQNAALALNGHAVNQAGLGGVKSSEAAFTVVLKTDDRLALYWANRGCSRFLIEDYASAITDLDRAIEIEPQHKYGRSIRGHCWMMLSDFSKALDDFNEVECTVLDDWEVAFYRGLLQENFQEWEPAVKDYLLAYDLESTRTEAGVALARLQCGCPDSQFRDGAKAVENATNMCMRGQWKDWVSVSVLGAAYAEVSDFDKAIRYAKLALDLAPEDEKNDRLERIAQYEYREPFRMP